MCVGVQSLFAIAPGPRSTGAPTIIQRMKARRCGPKYGEDRGDNKLRASFGRSETSYRDSRVGLLDEVTDCFRNCPIRLEAVVRSFRECELEMPGSGDRPVPLTLPIPFEPSSSRPSPERPQFPCFPNSAPPPRDPLRRDSGSASTCPRSSRSRSRTRRSLLAGHR